MKYLMKNWVQSMKLLGSKHGNCLDDVIGSFRCFDKELFFPWWKLVGRWPVLLQDFWWSA